ncbi:MAG TPA: nuclear transport factor 2 family protein [Bryobacteraceae bacterium]|jgi:ketosteroid isomerase-like protein|nr:nuclear transport factor 2 family protein [Bryobacteraceae bacterium]
MSANLDLIRSTYEIGPSVLLPALAPDVEWTEAAGFPYAGTYRGVDAIVKSVFARLGSEWEGFKPNLQDLYDAGETIIGTGFYEGTYRATNRPMRASFAHVFTLKDGKIVRFVQYVDSRKVWEAIEAK